MRWCNLLILFLPIHLAVVYKEVNKDEGNLILQTNKPEMLTLCGKQMTRRSKNVLGRKLAGLITRALNYIWCGSVPPNDMKEPGNTNFRKQQGKKSQICPRGSWEGSSKKVIWWIAQLWCLCIHACTMRNMQKEIEIDVIRKLWPNCYHRKMVG